jgi:3-deoxy-D-arabino-heptulosonate 7-phosphate (DAHP) synthase
MDERIVTENKEIVIVAGPCAVESQEQIMSMAHKISLIRDIVEPHNIQIKFRGGAWKPRTQLLRNGEKIFEGTREEGLIWLSDAAKKYNLSIVSEVMSEMDLRHFIRYLNPERDYLQIGARTNQAFALLYAVGGTRFNVILKNPPHGVDVRETVGSLQRFQNNRNKVFCTRGQRIIDPSSVLNPGYKAYLQSLYASPHQHPDSRHFNNIESIHQLRKEPFIVNQNILLCHDPSHVWGGKTDLMRRKIGEYAIKAIVDFGYDWIMLETDDCSANAFCDGYQAQVTTLNGIDWSKTYVRKEPVIKPLSLVEVVDQILQFQARRMGIDDKARQYSQEQLKELRWDIDTY